MRNILFIACLLLTVTMLVACGSTHTRGNQTLKGTSVTELDERITVGVSTKKDVENWLGTPSGIEKRKRGDRWKYHFTEGKSRVRGQSFIPVIGGLLGGVDSQDEERTLYVDFTPAGVVEAYGFDSTDGSRRN